MEKPVIIFGANGIGRAAYEIFKSNHIMVYGFLDDDPSLLGKEIQEVKVLGHTTDDGFLKFIGHKCEAFVATDHTSERKSQVKLLKEKRKVMPVNAIHQNSRIPDSVHLGHGNFINDSVVIGTNVKIGNHNILNAGCLIDFDAVIGDFVQLGTGSIIGQGVVIEDEVFIGTGAMIVPGLTLGKGARIGAGSVVVDHVKENETVFGNPARSVEV